MEVPGGLGNGVAEATDNSGSSNAVVLGSSSNSCDLVMDEPSISNGTSTGCSGNLSTSVADDSGKPIVVDVLGSGCASIGVSDDNARVSDGSNTFATGGSTMVFDGSGGVLSKDFSTDFI